MNREELLDNLLRLLEAVGPTLLGSGNGEGIAGDGSRYVISERDYGAMGVAICGVVSLLRRGVVDDPIVFMSALDSTFAEMLRVSGVTPDAVGLRLVD